MDFNVYVCGMEKGMVKVVFSYSNETLRKANTGGHGILEVTLDLKHDQEPYLEVIFKDVYSLKEFLNNN